MKLSAWLFVAGFAVAGSAPAAQAPVFSSRVEAVRVDVLVTDGRRIVPGLQAADFQLFDNGVLQEVGFVTFERLPLNVVLVFDMSDSVAGERLAHLRSAGMTLLDQLGPDDQAALVTFSHAVTIAAPLSTDRTRVRDALERADGAGRTALVDASHAGIVVGESDVARSLVILFTDGVDTASWLPADAVLDAARRSDVVVYGVSTAQRRTRGFAAELTSLTGGSLLQLDSTAGLAPAFVRILGEFRQRYLLSYTPRGVAPGGWHRLDVRVKGRRATVRARPGYMAAQ